MIQCLELNERNLKINWLSFRFRIIEINKKVLKCEIKIYTHMAVEGVTGHLIPRVEIIINDLATF